jgi:hypothetical protein
MLNMEPLTKLLSEPVHPHPLPHVSPSLQSLREIVEVRQEAASNGLVATSVPE